MPTRHKSDFGAAMGAKGAGAASRAVPVAAAARLGRRVARPRRNRSPGYARRGGRMGATLPGRPRRGAARLAAEWSGCRAGARAGSAVRVERAPKGRSGGRKSVDGQTMAAEEMSKPSAVNKPVDGAEEQRGAGVVERQVRQRRGVVRPTPRARAASRHDFLGTRTLSSRGTRPLSSNEHRAQSVVLRPARVRASLSHACAPSLACVRRGPTDRCSAQGQGGEV